MNSYELGLNINLSVPRLLIPRFMQSKRDLREQTHFQIGTDLMNRHNYFRMIFFLGGARRTTSTLPRCTITPWCLSN